MIIGGSLRHDFTLLDIGEKLQNIFQNLCRFNIYIQRSNYVMVVLLNNFVYLKEQF